MISVAVDLLITKHAHSFVKVLAHFPRQLDLLNYTVLLSYS